MYNLQKAIRLYKKKTGKNNRMIAQDLGLRTTTVYRWSSGAVNHVHLGLEKKVADYLGQDIIAQAEGSLRPSQALYRNSSLQYYLPLHALPQTSATLQDLPAADVKEHANLPLCPKSVALSIPPGAGSWQQARKRKAIRPEARWSSAAQAADVSREKEEDGFDQNVVPAHTYVEVARRQFEPGDFFVLMQDDALKDLQILPDDLLHIRPLPEIRNGTLALVMAAGVPKVRRLYRLENYWVLEAANPLYPPEVYTLEEVENLPVQSAGILLDVHRYCQPVEPDALYTEDMEENNPDPEVFRMFSDRTCDLQQESDLAQEMLSLAEPEKSLLENTGRQGRKYPGFTTDPKKRQEEVRGLMEQEAQDQTMESWWFWRDNY